jgi:hypothetical protein
MRLRVVPQAHVASWPGVMLPIRNRRSGTRHGKIPNLPEAQRLWNCGQSGTLPAYS